MCSGRKPKPDLLAVAIFLCHFLLSLKESGEKIFVRPKKKEKESFIVKRKWEVSFEHTKKGEKD